MPFSGQSARPPRRRLHSGLHLYRLPCAHVIFWKRNSSEFFPPVDWMKSRICCWQPTCHRLRCNSTKATFKAAFPFRRNCTHTLAAPFLRNKMFTQIENSMISHFYTHFLNSRISHKQTSTKHILEYSFILQCWHWNQINKYKLFLCATRFTYNQTHSTFCSMGFSSFGCSTKMRSVKNYTRYA